MKSVASIPSNYVSILQLQERWIKEKELKQHKQVVADLRERPVKKKNQQEEVESTVKLEVNGLVGDVVVKEEDVGRDLKRERNKKWPKKKKNQGKSMEEVVKCESRVYMSKGDNASSSKDSIAVETQFQDLCIKKSEEEEGKEVKEHTRLNRGQDCYRNKSRVWSSTRFSRPTRSMVWVKKNNVTDGVATSTKALGQSLKDLIHIP
ncbi:unnamed protein product [Cochlearia groenlandica]